MVAPAGTTAHLNTVVVNNIDSIRTSLKTAFLKADDHQQSHFVKIAETEYANPENEFEVIKLAICVPNVSFDNAKL